MPSIVNQQELLIIEIKEIQSLVEVCTSALRDTATCEDASVVDVLQMTSNRLWDLSESEGVKLKALEAMSDGGE